MSVQGKLYTAGEFWALIHDPQNNDKRLELIYGEVREMSLAGGQHGIIAMRLGAALLDFVEANNLGYVTAAETGYVLTHDPDTVRGPDVGFVKRGNAPDGLPKTYVSIPPDLAIEVVSPNDRARIVLEKVELFLDAGTALVWVVYPDDKVVDVWRRMEDGSLNKRKIDINGELDGEEVLPDFKLPLRGIFPKD